MGALGMLLPYLMGECKLAQQPLCWLSFLLFDDGLDEFALKPVDPLLSPLLSQLGSPHE